jgi:hypothetical protein
MSEPKDKEMPFEKEATPKATVIVSPMKSGIKPLGNAKNMLMSNDKESEDEPGMESFTSHRGTHENKESLFDQSCESVSSEKSHVHIDANKKKYM